MLCATHYRTLHKAVIAGAHQPLQLNDSSVKRLTGLSSKPCHAQS